MKKIFTGIITAAVAASLLAGCGGNTGGGGGSVKITKTTSDEYPIQTDQTLTYWMQLSGHVSATSQSLNETKFAEALQKETGIKVEFKHPTSGSAQEKEQFNLMVASETLPDIIEWSWNTYPGGPEKAIKEGTIISLNQVIDAGVSPNLQKEFEKYPDVKKLSMTETGNIYVYPFVIGDSILQTYRGPMVRGDLLEKYNLQKPETISEWETMLKTFKDNGVKVPLTFKMDNASFADTNAIVGAFGLAGTFFIDNGKVKFGPYEQKFTEYVETMQKWYQNGWFDSNFTDIDGKRITQIMSNGDGGSAFGSAGGDFGKWMPALAASVPGANYTPVKYPVMNKGDKPEFGQKNLPAGGFGAAISGTSKNPELAARLLDYGYSEKGHMLYNFGVENESFTMKDNKPVYTDIITDSTKNGGLGIGPAMGQYLRACYNGPFEQDKDYLYQFYTDPVQNEAIEIWADTDMLKHKMPNCPMTEEENKEYTKIMQDIDVYRQELLYKTIAGVTSLDEFKSTYFETMKSKGMDRAIELQQAAYDRYLAQ